MSPDWLPIVIGFGIWLVIMTALGLLWVWAGAVAERRRRER